MKQYFHLVFYMLTIIIIASCSNKRSGNNKFMVDFTNELDSVVLNEFISVERYIQLETDSNSFISEATKVSISNDRIYVLDQRKLMGLFIFDIEGRFLFKIQKLGIGPGEYRIISDFYIDDINQQITLLADGRRLIKFDIDGNFISEQKLPGFHYSFYLPFENSSFALANLTLSNPNFLIDFCTSNGNISKSFLKKPNNWERLMRAQTLGYSRYQAEYLFTYVCGTEIFAISNSEVSTKYKFQPPKQLVLSSDKVNDEISMDSGEFTMQSFEYFSFESFFENENVLFVEFTMNKQKFWGVLNKMDNNFKYIAIENIFESKSTKFIAPVFVGQTSSNKLVGVLYSHELLKDKQQVAFKGFNIVRDSNPIIVIAKLNN